MEETYNCMCYKTVLILKIMCDQLFCLRILKIMCDQLLAKLDIHEIITLSS